VGGWVGGVCVCLQDFREVVFALDTREDRHVKFHEALLKRAFPSNVKELFAFSFRPPWEKVAQRWSLYDPLEEFQRQGVLNPCSQWRFSICCAIVAEVAVAFH